MKLSRRNFVKYSMLLSFAGSVSTSKASTSTASKDAPKKIVQAIIDLRLPGIKTNDKLMDKFFSEFINSESFLGMRKAYSFFDKSVPLYNLGVFNRLPYFSDKLQGIEERVITQFTMSTNFFSKDFEIGKSELVFISYFDSDSTCNNIFANLSADSF